MDYKFQMPEWVNNPARIKKEAERQVELREAMNVRGRYSPAEKARMFAMRKEDNARTALEAGDWASTHQRDLLAEALLEQGKFEEAGAVAHSEKWKTEAARLHHAMTRDDDENCTCLDFDRNTKIPNHNTEKRVWSEKHQGYVAVRVCNLCGDTNIGAQMPNGKDLSEKRAQARSLAGGKMNSTGDIQALRARLTSAGLSDRDIHK